VTGAGSVVFRVPEHEHALVKSFHPKMIDGVVAKFGPLNSDMHASEEYRRSLIPEITRRALAHAMQV
jgi:carbon-monoxide dehydrogenase medium subunit